MTIPSIVLYHRDSAGREALARALREIGQVEHADSFPHAVELLALSAAACVLVDLPEDRRARAALAQVTAAYPHTKLFVLATDLPFDAVRELVRAGVCDVLRVPIDAAACAGSVREALAGVAAAPDRLRGMSVAVTAGKGGAGCTALALNLGAALAAQGGALVVDADAPPFGALAVSGDVEITGTVAGHPASATAHRPARAAPVLRPHPAGFGVSRCGRTPKIRQRTWKASSRRCWMRAPRSRRRRVEAGAAGARRAAPPLRRASLVLAVTTWNWRRCEASARSSTRSQTAPEGRPRARAQPDGSGGLVSAEQAAAALGRPFAAVLPYAAALRGRADRGELAAAADPQDPWSASVRRLAQTIVAQRKDAVRSALGDAGARDDG